MVRWALIAFHLVYMGGILFNAVLTGNLPVQGAGAGLFFVIQFNLYKRSRKALTIACCVIILLAAVYYLGLIGVASFTVLPVEAVSSLLIAVIFLILLEIATIAYVIRKQKAGDGLL